MLYLLNQKLLNKTKRNSNIKLEEFLDKIKHYLIMTNGGKPVYSWFCDEIEKNFNYCHNKCNDNKIWIFKEKINIISNKKNKIVFMKKLNNF